MGIGYSRFVIRGLGSKHALATAMSAMATQTSLANALQARFIENETAVWLRMAVRSKLFSRDVTSEILAEAEQLCRIVAASIRTAKSPQRQD